MRKRVVVLSVIVLMFVAGVKLGSQTQTCANQTIKAGCKIGKVNYEQPIFNGIVEGGDKCVYLYDADNLSSDLSRYECEVKGEILQYDTESNKLAVDDDVDLVREL